MRGKKNQLRGRRSNTKSGAMRVVRGCTVCAAPYGVGRAGEVEPHTLQYAHAAAPCPEGRTARGGGVSSWASETGTDRRDDSPSKHYDPAASQRSATSLSLSPAGRMRG